ncbi:[protein-PII] uridylyltransferase [Roseitranquillus sediminis]|uniref:[protein-PII] uridylyltransferase n=1 Tax=Roseitranquillus sediminis TaxID=2809051 RepID=UPI001D0CCCDF|nr:[protein-PII] uridylyltransferase [Roseitranquillus sediminis]MBM9595268.1 [protein-PII] uridylyltransferase [Roseitranquillus sediminis]
MTLPQDASAARSSEPLARGATAAPERPDLTTPLPNDLICPAQDIFDGARIRRALAADIRAAQDARAIRGVTVRHLKSALESGRAAIAAAFAARPRDSRAVVSAYTFLTDSIVQTVLDVALQYLHPRTDDTDGKRIAVMAVGGYGRAEMVPFSDVDLLFVIPWKASGWTESLVESMLYIFWDLHLKVGHATRTVRDCIRLGRDDFTIRTSLLEQRFVGGDAALARELRERLWKDLFRDTGPEFVEAKLVERAERHQRQGGQRYVVEPNVKEGKGGLRDLQALFWIAKYLGGVRDAGELVGETFTQSEFDSFIRAESFLLAVRCHMHLIAGRAVDQLTFDMQVEVADRMGYADTAGRRAVEVFMQDYFRHATRVGELTRIFLVALEDRHVKTAPSLQRLLSRKPRLRPPFHVLRNRLAIKDEAAFLNNPVNMIGVFDEALRAGLLLHPAAMRLIAANLHLIDDRLREDPEANRIFLNMLLRRVNPERGLRRMNELGVLGAFIPEFAPVVAMMQFNMYHHFTVDEHTIQCISTLSQIERGELVESLPIVSGILKEGVDRKVLYLAMLCHDIGKGRDEDHSVLGARIARRLAPRFSLKPAECDTVEWLVRYHLLMSDMAQKRDLSDPRTVRDFAKAVKSRKRLDLLTVLTVCDIRGVGPGVWNNWKAQLLRNLYLQTETALRDGLEQLNRGSREAEAKRALREALSDWDRNEIRAEIQRHYGPYWQGLPHVAQAIFARLMRGIGNGDVRMDLQLDHDRDATRACFAMVDHPGIFSRIAGALALVGANVVDARSYVSKDGLVAACFWVQDAEGHPYREERLPRLREMIHKTLMGEVVARDALVPKDKLKKRERAFIVPTSIAFDNEGSELYTIIEVDTRDRPGLLYDLTRTLAANNVQIASAVIATYGEQAVDTFYVKDMFGLKFHSEARRRALERKLREAIKSGAERARA